MLVNRRNLPSLVILVIIGLCLLIIGLSILHHRSEFDAAENLPAFAYPALNKKYASFRIEQNENPYNRYQPAENTNDHNKREGNIK